MDDNKRRKRLSLKKLTIRTLANRVRGGTEDLMEDDGGGDPTGYCTCRCSGCCPSGGYGGYECPGRPLVVDGEPRVADVKEGGDWED